MKKVGRDLGIKPVVIRGEELADKGLGGDINYLIIVEYI